MAHTTPDEAIAKVAQALGFRSEANTLMLASRRLMTEVLFAVSARNDETEFRTLVSMLPEDHEDRPLFLIAAEVKAKGLPQIGQRPCIDPTALVIGAQVVASDQYLNDHLHMTGESDIALDTGVIVGVHFKNAATGARLLAWEEGATAEVNVLWNQDETDPCPYHYLTKL